jgi:hypothetical protein
MGSIRMDGCSEFSDYFSVLTNGLQSISQDAVVGE